MTYMNQLPEGYRKVKEKKTDNSGLAKHQDDIIGESGFYGDYQRNCRSLRYVSGRNRRYSWK
ncbi:hypothetical protein H171_2492 [[Clostridium] celerecrescens 18A]|uniref:Uncharacterized protein n=1 Tax=[Clostridium] celerecrescens 18A TaxID=1286362 RepID=A0A2M8Z6A7_9FIRM|nr:hypothetical protein H171_2492 [[Clostridium] celerecrescens 18A]